jgi:hypothetical protein
MTLLDTPVTIAAGQPDTSVPLVAGIDVSLTSTGIAVTGGTTFVPSRGHRADDLTTRHARLTEIARAVLLEVGTVDLAVIEGPSYHSVGGSAWDRGGLWWLIVDGLLDRDIPVAVCPPACRARYATGSGAARKDAVMNWASSRYGVTLRRDDEADALILRAMGLHRLGYPLAPVPDRHAGALDGVAWPDFGPVAR